MKKLRRIQNSNFKIIGGIYPKTFNPMPSSKHYRKGHREYCPLMDAGFRARIAEMRAQTG